MNGIDHPLVLVHDLEAARARCASIGFVMTPVSLHPWGTATSLAVFENSLLEVMAVADASRLGQLAAGEFRFGEVVASHLAEREGVSLVALHSEDIERDAVALAERGTRIGGRIRFGREVGLPDGSTDWTSTSLLVLHDAALPRLSHFLCQQHRRDLIEVPRWMAHGNGAVGIAAIGVLARRGDWARVRQRFAGLYGAAAIEDGAGGFEVATGSGRFLVGDAPALIQRYGALPDGLGDEPCCVAVHVRVRSLAAARDCVAAAGVAPVKDLVLPPSFLGNCALVFEA